MFNIKLIYILGDIHTHTDTQNPYELLVCNMYSFIVISNDPAGPSQSVSQHSLCATQYSQTNLSWSFKFQQPCFEHCYNKAEQQQQKCRKMLFVEWKFDGKCSGLHLVGWWMMGELNLYSFGLAWQMSIALNTIPNGNWIYNARAHKEWNKIFHLSW